MSVFKLAMYPASEGDALILTWGRDGDLHHALVDLGRRGDYKAIRPLLAQIATFDLFVLSHIDADHIEGAAPLFEENPRLFRAEHVWFNAHGQLVDANERLSTDQRMPMGAAQAEKVSVGIIHSQWPWNDHFASHIVSVDSAEGMHSIAFPGGLSLILLSPSDRKLAKLLPVWDRELAKAGLRTTDVAAEEEAVRQGLVAMGGLDVERLAAEPFQTDNSAPNGTSIAFIAEFEGKRVLMGADSHPDLVVGSLRRLGASKTNGYRIDCLKVSHHGSKANTSPELLELIDCTCFAFSTDGTRHGHPDPQTIARILVRDPARKKKLIFNFEQDNTVIWRDPGLMLKWNYECIFAVGGVHGTKFSI